MDNISELKEILGGFLHWNKARLDCFSRMLIALFTVRTVNLKEMAVAVSGLAQLESRYKRLKRFFAQFEIDQSIISKWILKLFFPDTTQVYLTVDRTNWFWGKAKINILMVGIAYEGIAIPFCWKLLNKAGNASAAEHKAIIDSGVKIIGKNRILGVIADREFASSTLFNWFNKEKLAFYIRIKNNTLVYVRNKKFPPAQKLFNDLHPKMQKPFYMAVLIVGAKVYLAGSRSERGELMIVATNQKPQTAIAIYLRRWEIESLFQGLKSRGFRFEETHMIAQKRIEKLIALLAIGFCWAHKVGEWRAQVKSIVFNHYRRSQRPQYSYFRYSLNAIREAILHFSYRKKEFKAYLKCIILPPALLAEGDS